MSNKNPIIKGTLLLTSTGILCRFIGFLYRIFLSNLIGAEGLGIFQLIFPVLTFCIALSCGGIQITVSRFVAESKSSLQTFTVLISGIIMSILLSVPVSLVVYFNADIISTIIIHNANCNALLKYASFTIPMVAIHACISGYYLGSKRTFVPAWSGVVEQIVKLFSLYIFAVVLTNNGMKLTPLIAVFSMIVSELIGLIFCLIAICNEKIHKIHIREVASKIRQMFSISYILTLNKIMLTFLQCLETILIPYVLIKSGESESEALIIYGIVVGIALPVITFPSSITSSVCTMILPSIASANANNNTTGIKNTTKISVEFSSIIGMVCTLVFLIMGKFIGDIIFNEPKSGEYIQTLAWLCPFMYLSMTLGSILHGLGKTNTAFVHNVIGIVIQLIFLWFIVPKIGITGYLWGLLISNLMVTGLHGIYVAKYLN